LDIMIDVLMEVSGINVYQVGFILFFQTIQLLMVHKYICYK
jgi:hypothetical protein